MSGETPITLVGRLTADPELRYTPSGVAVADFTVCAQPRVFDKSSDSWGDGDPSFWGCSMWRAKGEAVAAALSKGNLVVLTGTVAQQTWQDENGNNRSKMNVTVAEIGLAIMPPRNSGQGGYGGQQRQQAQPNTGHPAGRAGEPDEPPF